MFEMYRPLAAKLNRKDPENESFLNFLRYRPLGYGKNGNEKLCAWVREYMTTYKDCFDVACHVDCGIDKVFELTNAINHPWIENPEVSDINHDTFLSSTSVGDFFKNLETGAIIVVLPFGFCQLDGIEL